MNKLGLLTIPLMAISLLTNCEKVPPAPEPENFNVTCTSGVKIANPTAIQNENYQTDLTTSAGIILPSQVDKVTVNNQEFTNYTYNKNSDNNASFSIEAQYVTGPIHIEVELKYEVTVTDGVTLKEGTEAVSPNTPYCTTLTPNSGYILTNEVTDVTVNSKKLTTDQYEYELKEGSPQVADFSIEAQYVTGPIHIELKLNCVVTVTEGVTLEEGSELATIHVMYRTNLTTNAGIVLPNEVTDVTVNGKKLTTEQYTYKLEEGTTQKANFSIEAQYVTGPIHIEVGLKYEVTVTDEVTLKEGTEAISPNTRYCTTLTPNSGYILPSKVTDVTVNSKKLTTEQYEYKLKEDSPQVADFSIEAQYVTGPIHIELKLNCVVTVTEGVVLKEGTNEAIINVEYETDLTVTGTTILPNNITSVTVGGKQLTTDQYEYELKEGSTQEAIFSIEGQYVTGPIHIEISVGKIYVATIDATGGEHLTLTKGEFNTLEDYETTISFNDEEYHDKKLPNNLISVTSDGAAVPYSYTISELKRNEATLKIDKSQLKGDVVITLPSLTDKSKWYEFSDWWNYCSTAKDGIPIAATNEIGQIVGVEVNGLMHKVRLIDVEHKNLGIEGYEAHCTFEFANVITDSTGVPVPTEWNNKEGDQSTNYNFPDSTLNDLLNKGDNCIFKALPIGLQQAIKEVNKKVGINESYTSIGYSTKLFPLAYYELINPENETGVPSNEGLTYSYYKLNPDPIDRVKKPVNKDTATDYWLRSPYTGGNNYAWYINNKNEPYFIEINITFTKAIAPAFCI